MTWISNTNFSKDKPKRQADLYIFCVETHTVKKTLDPLNLNQWEFYIIPTKVLNKKVPEQKSITLGSLKKLNSTKVSFDEIKKTIDKM